MFISRQLERGRDLLAIPPLLHALAFSLEDLENERRDEFHDAAPSSASAWLQVAVWVVRSSCCERPDLLRLIIAAVLVDHTDEAAWRAVEADGGLVF